MRVTSGKSRVRESRLPGSVRAEPNGRATRPLPANLDFADLSDARNITQQQLDVACGGEDTAARWHDNQAVPRAAEAGAVAQISASTIGVYPTHRRGWPRRIRNWPCGERWGPQFTWARRSSLAGVDLMSALASCAPAIRSANRTASSRDGFGNAIATLQRIHHLQEAALVGRIGSEGEHSAHLRSLERLRETRLGHAQWLEG